MVKRTLDERKAYFDGYEMCAKCVRDYLTDEGRQKLDVSLKVVRSVTKN